LGLEGSLVQQRVRELIAHPTEAGQFLINGSPVVIATQLPDVLPGTTPIAFGGWKAGYTVVTRRAPPC